MARKPLPYVQDAPSIRARLIDAELAALCGEPVDREIETLFPDEIAECRAQYAEGSS